MPAALLQAFLHRVADEFAAIQARTTFAILRPEVQMPWLIIRQHTGDRIDEPVRPRIDGHGLRFDDLRQRLACKGQQRRLREIIFTQPAEARQLTQRVARQLRSQRLMKIGIGEEKSHGVL